ncbi:hypothetical protein FIU88_09785 [Halomonas sp. THAF12]|nr:hypothetical protein FIU88_09785 [Halomonas sp. THAF12]
MSDDNPIKRWTAKRKAAVVMDILKGKTTSAEVVRRPSGRAHENSHTTRMSAR